MESQIRIQKERNNNKKEKHDKYHKDNIIRRFKVFIMKNIYTYINNFPNLSFPIFRIIP